MSEVIVFYAGQVYWEFAKIREYGQHRMNPLIDSDIYNGAYVWYRQDVGLARHWYRMDGTPVLLEEVPKALRAWALILT